MNWKNFLKINYLKYISLLILGLILLLIAIILNDPDGNDIITNRQANDFSSNIYIIVSLVTFGLGYLEIANTTKLGMGITRYAIYKRFMNNIGISLIILFFITIYHHFFVYLVQDENSFIRLFNFKMLLFLNLMIITLGQLGMLFGNVKINKYIGVSFVLIIIVLILFEAYLFENKLLINIILSLISIILFIVNYGLIKNIRIERS